MCSQDGSLLKCAIAGDRAALATLLERHAPGLRSKIAHMIPRRWLHLVSEDDVLQQTYVDTVRDVGSFLRDDEASFACWLESLARRNLVDAIRMLEAGKRGGGWRRVQGGTADDDGLPLLEVLAATATTPSRCAARDEARVHLRKAIKDLPEVYRQVVELYDIEGQPVEEVARRLQRSCGAIYMLRARAHRVLCELMGTVSDFLSTSA